MAESERLPTYDEIEGVDTSNSTEHVTRATSTNGSRRSISHVLAAPPSYDHLFGVNQEYPEGIDPVPGRPPNRSGIEREIIDNLSTRNRPQTEADSPLRTNTLLVTSDRPPYDFTTPPAPTIRDVLYAREKERKEKWLRWEKKCKAILKKLGKVYGVLCYISLLPVSIIMLVYANNDGPRSSLEPTSTTTTTTTISTTSLSSATTNHSAYQMVRENCRGQTNVPFCLTGSGGIGIVVWAVLTVCIIKRYMDKNTGGIHSVELWLFMIAFFTALSFYFGGVYSTYKLWISRPNCDPFDEFGCPYWYCDNRLFMFSVCFYLTSILLLLPIWVLVICFIGWPFKKVFEDCI